MKPADDLEILAYPLERVACPDCAIPYPTPPRGSTLRSERISPCQRCNGARVVYRSAPTKSARRHLQIVRPEE